MKKYLKLFFLIAAVLHGCGSETVSEDKSKINTITVKSESLLNEEQRNELYKKVKAKNMNELSRTEKQKTVEDWVTLLKSDPDYINAESSLKQYTSEIVNRDHSKDSKNEGNRPDPKKDPVKYYESRGIQNPNKAATSQLNLVKSYLIILQKYPELRNIEKSTRKEILTKAAGQTNYSDIKKNRK
ncbi:hypothetical protein [Pseudopedobacter beijingensis]|uniref:Lipoprotein n=1 Tax=Pseudopedobacter beijingensis TaxID=1207056 RepID=A0ABW4IEB2_9SPHI